MNMYMTIMNFKKLFLKLLNLNKKKYLNVKNTKLLVME